MMKKLSLILVLCFAHIAQADLLSDAIRFSDLQQVESLLSQTVLTEKQLNKYLDLAEHVITARREQLKNNTTLTDYRWSKKTNEYGRIMVACLASMLVCSASTSAMVALVSDSSELLYAGIGGLLFVGSAMGAVLSGLNAAICMANDRRSWYSNALSIKELLHDYEVSSTIE